MLFENKIYDLLEAHPIIAAVRDETGLEAALKSTVAIVFLLNATLTNLKERVKRIEDAQKWAFVHLEMVAGLSKDQVALDFIQTEIGPSGILTTKPNLIHAAKSLG